MVEAWMRRIETITVELVSSRNTRVGNLQRETGHKKSQLFHILSTTNFFFEVALHQRSPNRNYEETRYNVIM